jgi:lipid II:glycine glycyltransferase (peptidoglycan interpeptide bridge formation enzyme)
VLKDMALPEAQAQLERERKELEEVLAQLSQAAEKAREFEKTGAALQEAQSQLQLA